MDEILEQFEIEVWKLIDHAQKRGVPYIELLRIICKGIPDLVQKAIVGYMKN